MRHVVVLAILVLVLVPLHSLVAVQNAVSLPAAKSATVVPNVPLSDPIPPVGQRVTLDAEGVAFLNDSGNIMISKAGLALNLTVQFTNSTGIEFQVDDRVGQHGILTIVSPYRNFDVSFGQAFLSFSGHMTIQAQPVEIGPRTQFELFLIGPGRFVNGNTGFHFFARLFGTLYNSTTKIGLLLVSGFSPGDVDMDGRVDVGDLAAVGSAFGTSYGQPGYNPYANLNLNGNIGIQDLALVGSSFGMAY